MPACLHINTFVRREVDGMLGHRNLLVVCRGIGIILFLLERRRREIARNFVKIDQKCWAQIFWAAQRYYTNFWTEVVDADSQIPPPTKYMCRLENDDLDMLCMLHGCASMFWLLFISFHWSSIESFQSRLICVYRIFHVVTGTWLNVWSSNSNFLSSTCIAFLFRIERTNQRCI